MTDIKAISKRPIQQPDAHPLERPVEKQNLENIGAHYDVLTAAFHLDFDLAEKMRADPSLRVYDTIHIGLGRTARSEWREAYAAKGKNHPHFLVFEQDAAATIDINNKKEYRDARFHNWALAAATMPFRYDARLLSGQVLTEIDLAPRGSPGKYQLKTESGLTLFANQVSMDQTLRKDSKYWAFDQRTSQVARAYFDNQTP